MTTHDVEVLVIGLGPVGSVLGLHLARHGVTVAAIDAAAAGATDLRASTFHAATLELLDRIDVADGVIAQGLKAPVYQFRDRQAGDVFAFDLTEIADRARFPYRLQCEQHRMARDVAAKLAAEPLAQIGYNRRLLTLEQDADGVTALIETPTGVERYRARYVVGCDGGNSTTRKLLGIDFAGFTYAEKYLTYSTEYPLEEAFEGLSHVNYISDPDEWLVLLHVPGFWRVMIPIAEEVDDAYILSDEGKDAAFRRVLGHDAIVETRHRTIYRIHQRVCERFASGRVMLAGDAAHLNSPVGEFGMNSGIHDAFNIAEKLEAILREGADPRLIELYDRQRRTVTHDVIQAESIGNMKAMRAGWSTARDERRAHMLSLMGDADARRAFLLRQSMFTSLDQAAAIT